MGAKAGAQCKLQDLGGAPSWVPRAQLRAPETLARLNGLLSGCQRASMEMDAGAL